MRRGEPARMWFRRIFRRRRPPPPVLLPSLERLAELIERVVELLDEVALGPPRQPAPPTTPAPASAPSPAPNPGHSVSGHLLLVSWPDGYRLLEREGAAARPARPAGRRRRRIQRAPARAFAAAGRLAPLRVPREGGTVRRWIEPSTGEGREPDPRHARRASGRPRAGRAGTATIGGERPGAVRDAPTGARARPPARRRAAPVFPEPSARPVTLR